MKLFSFDLETIHHHIKQLCPTHNSYKIYEEIYLDHKV